MLNGTQRKYCRLRESILASNRGGLLLATVIFYSIIIASTKLPCITI